MFSDSIDFSAYVTLSLRNIRGYPSSQKAAALAKCPYVCHPVHTF